eukprot:c54274_g1_i1.p1 GENE.c54274_g1_i1~~c54274_g1_i1.p1  ORF type:complete len:354 (+),score=63.78 c54274_g1_i1:204-1265(+)
MSGNAKHFGHKHPGKLAAPERVFTAMLLALNAIVLAALLVQVVKSIRDRRKKLSFYFVFLILCSAWTGTRSAFFGTLTLYGRPRSQLFWVLLYSIGPNFVFATFSLLALFYARTLKRLNVAAPFAPDSYFEFRDSSDARPPRSGPCVWVADNAEIVWFLIANGTLTLLFGVWAIFVLLDGKHVTDVRLFFSTAVFGVLVALLSFYSVRFTHLLTSGVDVPVLRTMALSKHALVYLTYGLLVIFLSRLVWDIFSALGMIHIEFDDRLSLQAAFIVSAAIIIWELLPITLVLMLFRVRGSAMKESGLVVPRAAPLEARQARYAVNDSADAVGANRASNSLFANPSLYSPYTLDDD